MSHEIGGGADEKARIERMCISLLMSKNLKTQKVIKSFVPELSSRKCFSCFEIPMFYVCYERSMYVSHISVSGYVTENLRGFISYFPTPPLGQDMTQGQFFKRSLTGLNSEFSFS